MSSAKQSQLGPGSTLQPGGMVPNKPNSGRPPVRPGPLWGAKNAKQTQFGPGSAGTGGTECAKQTQFAAGGQEWTGGGQGRPSPRGRVQACETNPIPPELFEWQVLWRQRVMTDGTVKRPPQNKANSSIADWGQICGGTPGPRPVASGLGPFPGPSVRNKANLGNRAQTPGRVTKGGKINWASRVFFVLTSTMVYSTSGDRRYGRMVRTGEQRHGQAVTR